MNILPNRSKTRPVSFILSAAILMGALSALSCNNASETPVGEQETADARPGFWYEENNGDAAGQYPDDFYDMFARPETWDNLRPHVDTYIIRGNSLTNLLADPKYGESFFRDHFVPVLNEAGITLAIDNPVGRFEAVDKVVEMGANLTHLSLQSAISKTADHPDSTQARVDRAVRLLTEFKERYPEARVGFGDATPTKMREYKGPYREVSERLEEAGYSLDFVHLDAPFEAMEFPNRGFSWDAVKEAERFVKEEIGADFGFIATSRVAREMERETGERNPEVWHKEFFERVTSIPQIYPDEGSLPDYFILNSWYAVPENAVPEDAPEGVYPMTKVALHLVEAMHEEYGQGGTEEVAVMR